MRGLVTEPPGYLGVVDVAPEVSRLLDYVDQLLALFLLGTRLASGLVLVYLHILQLFLDLLHLVFVPLRLGIDICGLLFELGFLLLALVLLSVVLDIINGVQFVQHILGNILGVAGPELDVLLRVRAKVAVEVVFPDALPVALGLLALETGEPVGLPVPSVDPDALLIPTLLAGGPEEDELLHGEHVVLGLEGIRDDMGAQGYELDALKLAAHFPRDIVDTELQSLRCVQQQQDS